MALLETLNTYRLIVQLFILLSTSVSYFRRCWNFLDGAADSVHLEIRRRNIHLPLRTIRSVAYLACFGSTIFVVVSNPEGFISVLTRLAATAQNLQCGVMLFVLVYVSHKASRSVAAPSTVNLSWVSVINDASSTLLSQECASCKPSEALKKETPLPL